MLVKGGCDANGDGDKLIDDGDNFDQLMTAAIGDGDKLFQRL